MFKAKFLAVAGALGAFFAMGPLQQAGVLPQTMAGEASKVALGMLVGDAHACPPGNSKGSKGGRGNNGFGNGGGDGVPGRSGFQDRTR